MESRRPRIQPPPRPEENSTPEQRRVLNAVYDLLDTFHAVEKAVDKAREERHRTEERGELRAKLIMEGHEKVVAVLNQEHERERKDWTADKKWYRQLIYALFGSVIALAFSLAGLRAAGLL